MQKNIDFHNGDGTSTTSKKSNRCRSFHFRYLELCRSKNVTPLSEIRTKNNSTTMLEFFGDKIAVNDWLLVTESLFYDQVLQTLAIRLRKCLSSVFEHMDTEKKAKLFKQKPAIYTKFVFSGVVEAVSNCIEFNKNLKILHLEGLPLSEKYCEMIAKALSSNETLKDISFQRSPIMDAGCQTLCNTLKYLDNVEKLNMSDCMLTTKGAEYVAEMIKMQKISRFTEGWQKSLRYREFDPDDIPGLKSIALARNPQIGDDGLKAIVEVLKEDFGVKIVDMENCGLTDRAANLIMDCLEINQYIMDFNIRNNAGVSKFVLRNVREQLGKDDDDQRTADELIQQGVRISNAEKKSKVTIPQLMEQLKCLQEQVNLERNLRKKAEQLNEKLNLQIMAYESQMEKAANNSVPEGFVVVKHEALQCIIKERGDFEKLATQAIQGMQQQPHSPRDNIFRSKMLNLNVPQKIFEEDDEPFDDDDDKTETEVVVSSQRCSPQVSSRSGLSGAGPSPRPGRLILNENLMAMKSGIRKVKSEMKYIEEVNKNLASHKKESKSDYEFPSEVEAPRFEMNIGDTVEVTNNQIAAFALEQQQMKIQKRTSTRRDIRKNINSQANGDFDRVSLSTTLSDSGSHASQTLRNKELESMADYGGHTSTTLKKLSATSKRGINNLQQEYGQGEGVNATSRPKSPRSVFMGLY